MGGLAESLLVLFIYIAPAMVANGTPVILHGPPPIDFGKRMPDGRRVFGDGKTWGGLLAGITAGTFVGIVEWPFLGAVHIAFASMASVGALCGDLFGSFLKRRVGLERGAEAPVLDQLGFYIFALIFLYIAGISFSIYAELIWAIIIYALHRLTNWAAYMLGLKSVPW
jgi:CDP-2,3-bis-(O-geranylgeranyl)-sn-glycerol synthase